MWERWYWINNLSLKNSILIKSRGTEKCEQNDSKYLIFLTESNNSNSNNNNCMAKPSKYNKGVNEYKKL